MYKIFKEPGVSLKQVGCCISYFSRLSLFSYFINGFILSES